MAEWLAHVPHQSKIKARTSSKLTWLAHVPHQSRIKARTSSKLTWLAHVPHQSRIKARTSSKQNKGLSSFTFWDPVSRVFVGSGSF